MKLADQLRLVPGQQVLDVACGVGGWLEIAASRGATISGIDISERAIDICRQRLPEGEFQVGPAETLPFPDRRFDLITCLGSLEHFWISPVHCEKWFEWQSPTLGCLYWYRMRGFDLSPAAL